MPSATRCPARTSTCRRRRRRSGAPAANIRNGGKRAVFDRIRPFFPFLSDFQETATPSSRGGGGGVRVVGDRIGIRRQYARAARRTYYGQWTARFPKRTYPPRAFHCP